MANGRRFVGWGGRRPGVPMANKIKRNRKRQSTARRVVRRSDLGSHPLTPAIWQSLCVCGFPLASHRDSTNRTIDCYSLHVYRIARRETYPIK